MATPRETRCSASQLSRTPDGSAITATSACRWPFSASHFEPTCPPASSSAVNTTRSVPRVPATATAPAA